MQTNGMVVVGVDGTPESRAAIEYALRDADRRKALLRVVAVARPPEYWAVAYGAPALPSPEEIKADMQVLVKAMVDEAVAANPQTAGVPVAIDAIIGAPSPALVEAAEGADLLVLGHRGRGAVRSVLLGSVGLHCVLHAPCPVTVVRSAAVREPNGVGASPAS